MPHDRATRSAATPPQFPAALRIALACLLALASTATAQTFQPLGFLPEEGGFGSVPTDVSANGRVVVGFVYDREDTDQNDPEWGFGFRWEGDVMTKLPCVPLSVSDNGRTLAGACLNAQDRPVLLVDGVKVDLPLIPTEGYGSPTMVSGDGQVAFTTRIYQPEPLCMPGYCPSYGEAVRVADGFPQQLGFVVGDLGSDVRGVSFDGSVAAISSYLPSADPEEDILAFHAARWQGSMLDLGSLPSGAAMFPRDVSSDGSTIVGYSIVGDDVFQYYPWRWSAAGGLVGIALPLGGAAGTGTATSVSGDGQVIVGAYLDDSMNRRAFIWTAETGSRDLQEKLENEQGVDFDGWLLYAALEISRDASTIVGLGRNPDTGLVSGWRFGPTGPSLVVNVTVDEDNADESVAEDVCDVDRDEDGPQCSLRAAIDLANARGGDTIAFDVPGDGIPEFRLGDSFQHFPPLSSRIVLDGTTQPGVGKVMLIGRGFEGDMQHAGIDVGSTGAGSTIKGLVIHGFRGGGIALLPGADDCEITNNVIGTDADGRTVRGNGGVADIVTFGGTAGVMLLSSGNTVEDNVIAGNIVTDGTNFGGGVDLYVGPNADFNHVRGNRLGVGSDGKAVAVPEEIEAFVYYAVIVAGGQGNVIGYDDGELPLDPTPFPQCEDACNVIGRLIVVGLFGTTIQPTHTPPSDTMVAGNSIGVDPDGALLPGFGTVALYRGVRTRMIANTIGVSGQAIGIDGSGHRIEANLIVEDPVGGVNDYAGAINLSSAEDVEVIDNEIRPGLTRGIHQSSSERIHITGNLISGRTLGGIVLEDDAPDANTALLSQNRIVDSGVSIDLGANGATRNDGGDTDSGPNDYLNFPVVNAVTYAGGSVTLLGFVPLPFTTASHTLEVFSSTRCNDSALDPNGGQAERYLGSYSAEATLSDPEFTITIDGVATDHRYLALTTSLPDRGITSEMSRCVAIASPDEVASADVPTDGTGVALDAQGATVTVGTQGTAAGFTRGAASGGGKLYVTRYARAPETNVFADATAAALGGVQVRPDAVAPRYWYISDRKLTATGGGVDGRTFDVCVDPTNVVRPLALRSVVVMRRDEATGGKWLPYATSRRLRDDGAVYLCAVSVPALGEFALGGAPAAFSDGPLDACSTPTAGVAGAQCACDLMPPVACDVLPKAIAKPAEVACGKVAQASTETKAKRQKRLLRGAKAGFKKALKKLAGKQGRSLHVGCRAALTETLRAGQGRLE